MANISDLSCTLTKTNPKDLNEFGTMFASTLDKHAPHKLVRVRANNKPHLNKTLRKAMMQRTRLKNIANKTGNKDDLKRFRKQRNLVVKLNRDAKRNFYSNIDPTKAGKEKVFWKTFKPLFSSSQANNKIILVEGEEIISDDKQIAECFNSYFANIVDTINIPPDVTANDYEPIDDPVLNAINKYANHPSILRIKERFTSWETFEFSKVDHTLVYSEIMHLDKTKKRVVMFR